MAHNHKICTYESMTLFFRDSLQYCLDSPTKSIQTGSQQPMFFSSSSVGPYVSVNNSTTDTTTPQKRDAMIQFKDCPGQSRTAGSSVWDVVAVSELTILTVARIAGSASQCN